MKDLFHAYRELYVAAKDLRINNRSSMVLETLFEKVEKIDQELRKAKGKNPIKK